MLLLIEVILRILFSIAFSKSEEMELWRYGEMEKFFKNTWIGLMVGIYYLNSVERTVEMEK